MSIVYCDYLIGDDATGSGTNVLPYKTITQASTGLTGGDEVRVAKSTAVTTMSGTLAWVEGSTSITTSANLTSVLSAGDFVGKDTEGETWWEAITITSDTLTLYKKYSDTTETVSSKKLGITSTGEAVASATNIQTINSSGSSSENRLKILGGWDLSTETRDGHTYFRQMHGTFSTRYGRGLYSNSDYVEFRKVSFLRYDTGIYFGSSSSYNLITDLICNSNDDGIYNNGDQDTITDVVCNANGTGYYSYYGHDHTLTSSNFNSNAKGVYSFNGLRLTLVDINCIHNSSDGINLYSVSTQSVPHSLTNVTSSYNTKGIVLQYQDDMTITNPVCNNNTYDGIDLSYCNRAVFTTPICNDNGDNGIEVNTCKSMSITTPTCNNNDDRGIYMSNSPNASITTPPCTSNNVNGIHLIEGNNATITEPICTSNTAGIYMQRSINTTILKSTCNNNTSGIYADEIFNCVMTVFSGTGNTTDIYVKDVDINSDAPVIKCQHLNGAGINKCFYEDGITERDTVEARSGECLKLDPTSDTYYIRQNFNFRAASGVEQTLSAYIKDDTDFNGDIQAAIYFMGIKITGWTEWTPTTSYVQKSIVAASGDITEDGVLELAIKVRGTAGNVYVDDLGAS